ncbi:MAG: MFS transporter [Gammaproteobacteria bacterium]|nr:MFS transporter [Gammaproteobacteria bacterium]MYK81407.1 MFS transporter [Gammaproteobacteria bacterium]
MTTPPADRNRWPNPLYGWYVTLTLLLAYTFSFVDRQVLNLLVEPIQADLGLSDTQISLLQGLAFVFTYVALSVPIGRMVDRFNRVAIMIGGVLVWSATTVACGLSRSFEQLFAARLGVGAGEATVTPASWSLLSDYFPPERLSRPISVYLMGPYIGGGMAMIAGATVLDWTEQAGEIALPLVGALAPWQFTFIAVGLPGLLIAALLLTVREPERKNRERVEAPPWRDVVGFLRRHWRIYLSLHLGVPCIVVMLYGLQGWVPTVMVRVYGWELAEVGRIYGIIALVAGSAGVLTGPTVARLLERRGHADQALPIAAFSATAAAASLALLPWQASPYAALGCVFAASFFVTLPLALMTSAIQLATPNDMRGVVSGLYVVTTNVIGLGLGPTLVAGATDYVFADPKAVAYSLAMVSWVMGPLAAGLLLSGHRAYRERLRALRLRQSERVSGQPGSQPTRG